MNIVNKNELKRMMDSGEKFTLADVRYRISYDYEHIRGAVSLPIDELDRAKDLFGVDNVIVVYCDSFDCDASEEAADKLPQMGFKNVLRYQGGIKEWKEAGLPIERGQRRPWRPK